MTQILMDRHDSFNAFNTRTAILGIVVICLATAAGVFTDVKAVGALVRAVENAAPLVPIAIGAAVIISCGEIDLSIAGTYSLSGMLVLWGAAKDVSPEVTIGVVFVVALMVGAIVGGGVVYLNMSSIIGSLAVAFMLFGVAYIIHHELLLAENQWYDCVAAGEAASCGDDPITGSVPPEYRGAIFKYSVVWAVVVTGGMHVLLSRTRYGLHHRAVGLDAESARLAGLNIKGVKMLGFLVSAVLAALSALLMMVGFNGGGWPVEAGKGKELIAIAAAVIGGTSIYGGRFKAVNVALAVILWQAILNITDWLEFVPTEAQQFGLGAILGLVVLSGIRRNRAGGIS